MKPTPYPADIRAKGWRLELDHERIRQSDTWALASPDARPWLLMLWMVAWEQTPCGSMPADDELIAAKLDMSPKTFAKHRKVLMRGWWEAEDGRLYHDTLAARVVEMIGKRRKESDRKAMQRHGTPPDGPNVPRDKLGTDIGLHREGDTGTGTSITGTSTENQENTHTQGGGDSTSPVRVFPDDAKSRIGEIEPTHAGRVCRAMKSQGIADTNPGHPDLLALIAADATDEQFVGAAADAVSRGKGFAYAVGALKRQRIAAAETVRQMHHGPLPPSVKEQAAREKAAKWSPHLAPRRPDAHNVIDMEPPNAQRKIS